MASQPPSRATNTAERRTSASIRQKTSRPTSAALSPIEQESRGANGPKRKTTTTTESKRDVTSQETFVRRTARVALKPAESNAKGGRSREVEQAQKADAAPIKKGTAEAAPSSWSPQASLLPPTSAPLACRISVPPQACHAPESVRAKSLSTLSLQEQEEAIISDLLFVCMGFEGQYIRYDGNYQPLDEKSRLSGPPFRMEYGLDPSLRDLASSMLKTATHYCAVEAFVEVQSREDFGTVNHALCAAMRKLLKDYLILIAQLEHQTLTNENFTLLQLNLHMKPTAHLMHQLYTVAHEILKENSMLDSAEDDLDQTDDFENILESLREGRETAIPGKKVCKGGSVLRLLTRRLQAMSGDPAARQLLTTLLKESSRPYMTMLNEWLHHGNVRDPHNEFLIKEQKSIRREGLEQDYTDEYWEKRYTIRTELVPPQLDSVKEKVLLAGKYLNVVRECGGIDNIKDRNLDARADVPHTFDDPRFAENVSNAYAFANRSLMTLLLTTHALPARLRSLKHYFFLDRSDFFSYFLELTHSELKKSAKNVNVSKLQSLLDIVLRQPGSVAAEDSFKEDVKVVMSDAGLTGWLMRVVNVQGMDADASTFSAYTPAPAASATGDSEKEISGYEALTLDYAVPFPLSLVVSRVTLTRYQLLFRYLLSLRHLETLLTSSWTEHTKNAVWTKRSTPRGKDVAAKDKRVEEWKRRAWCLRSRMLCFVQQLLYFCTCEVIEPNWGAFMGRLNQGEEVESDVRPGSQREGGKAPLRASTTTTAAAEAKTSGGAPVKRTVDELMQDHVDFLATCLKECMLTNSKLLRINSKVMATCTMFANYTSSLSRYLAAADPSSSTSSTNSTSYDPAKLDKLFSILQQYEDHFSRHLKILLDALNYLAATETVVFLGLCARLSMANEGGPGGGPGPGAYG
ncbi:gamma tubulin complex Spc97/GCP2 subunit Alp4 [Vermiconidia calcicola]|uniref:Gamma tubulin complex Spc97/GCP2 subunit Alp4 n=1 Tax=Vermiconidia calcicola TaxID=1690605 RepID=A0ACC3MZ34_9PEZI|nr:gamma tubulin complex Spc97/GCP2 subunit Alp4 [Vermiconidia calcicola]